MGPGQAVCAAFRDDPREEAQKYLTPGLSDVLLLFMPRTLEKQERVEAMLGEVAELSLVAARELTVRLRESEDVTETVALADAFQKVSRAMRLTLALDAKLDRDAERDAERDAREAAREAREAEAGADKQRTLDSILGRPARRTFTPAEGRKARVHNLLNRLIWNESEGDSEEYEVLLDDLSARLDEAALSDDFETLPVEVLAQRVIKDMGLSGKLTLSLGERPPDGAPAPHPTLTDIG
jgi:hypothetical protein